MGWLRTSRYGLNAMPPWWYGLVTNFPLWVECYAALVATLSTRYPEKMSHFMAYLQSQGPVEISRAQCGHHMIWRSDAKRQIYDHWSVVRVRLPAAGVTSEIGKGPETGIKVPSSAFSTLELSVSVCAVISWSIHCNGLGANGGNWPVLSS